MADEIARLIARVEADASNLRVGIEKANTSLDTMARATTKADSGMRTFVAGLKAAGGAALAWKAIGFAQTLIQSASAIDDLSKRTGIGTTALQSLGFAAKKAGVDQASLQASLQQFTQRVGEARTGTGSLVLALKDNDRALLDNLRSTTSMDQALDIAADAIAKASTAADKATIANKLLGRAGIELVPILKDGAAGLRQMTADAERNNQVIGTEGIKALSDFGSTINRIKGFWNTAFSEMLATSANFFTKALGGSEQADTTIGKIQQITAEIDKLREAQANAAAVGSLPREMFDLTAQIAQLEAQRDLLSQLVAKNDGYTASVASVNAAIKPLASDTKKLADEQKAAGDAAKQLAEEQQKVADAVLDLANTLQGDAQKAIDDFVDSVDNLVWDAQLAGMTDAQKQLAELSRQYDVAKLAAEGLGTSTEELDAKLDAGVQSIVNVGKAADDTAKKVSTAASQIGDAFAEAFEGIALGTRELSDIPDLFRDAFAKAFFDTLREKSGFDALFKGNIFDLIGDVGNIVGGLPGVFSNVFDAILGDKASFDGLFSGGTLGIGTSLAGAVVGGGGAVGGGIVGSKLGGSAGGVVGAILGQQLASNAFSFAVTGQLTPFTSKIISALAPSLAKWLGPAIAQSTTQAGAQISGIGMTLADGTVIPSTGGGLLGGLQGVRSTISPFVGPALGVAGAGLGALGVYNAYNVGGTRGGVSGALSGAGAGASIGSVIPGLGTVLGALIGGLVGGLAGAFGGGPPSSGQLSRRFLGNQILGGTSAITGIGSMLNFDPYVSGVTSIAKAMETYPELFDQAGNAAQAFGTVLSLSVDSGQNDAKELNFVVSTLIDNFGRAGVTGPDAIVRVAASMRELGIDTTAAGQAVQQAFDQGLISADQYNAAIAGLADVTAVTVDQMVATLKGSLEPAAVAVFDRIVAAGGDAFDAVTAAADASFVSLASGLQDQLLPAAVLVFEAMKQAGITSASAIASAFANIPSTFGAGGLTVTPPGTSTDPNFPAVFGTSANIPPGSTVVPTPGGSTILPPPSSGIPAFFVPAGMDSGGIVPGPLGARVPIIAHGGETFIPTHSGERMREFADMLADAIGERGGRSGGRQILVVPVSSPADLPRDLARAKRAGRLGDRSGRPMTVGMRVSP